MDNQGPFYPLDENSNRIPSTMFVTARPFGLILVNREGVTNMQVKVEMRDGNDLSGQTGILVPANSFVRIPAGITLNAEEGEITLTFQSDPNGVPSFSTQTPVYPEALIGLEGKEAPMTIVTADELFIADQYTQPVAFKFAVRKF